MAHMFETGWFANTAAWHKLGDVKKERPTTWEEARRGYLDWEPQPATAGWWDEERQAWIPSPGWKAVIRDDTKFPLTFQEESYAVIGNEEFGNLIEYVMGIDLPGMPRFQFETLAVLRNGRTICVSLWLPESLQIPGDESKTFPFMNFWTNHDGQGGLKGGAGTFRVVCANTQMGAESEMNSHGFMFSIRHTVNWADKINEARGRIAAAVGNVATLERLAQELASRRVEKYEVVGFVERWLPINEDWTDARKTRMENRRRQFWNAYKSDTCSGISGTAYGIQQAAIEVCDHAFTSRSNEARAARQLMGGYKPKQRALQLVSQRWG